MYLAIMPTYFNCWSPVINLVCSPIIFSIEMCLVAVQQLLGNRGQVNGTVKKAEDFFDAYN